ncbi:alpha/beta fold hydrolase [Nocardia sp. NPDC058518]|uniref:alpha/beta fold hydrolase n=1 Tax=Nocardia sp. NPDC058518 TaxID=3346534 RepID=UPI00365516C3
MNEPMTPCLRQLERPDGAILRGRAVGTGPTVLLLHAGGERSEVWDPVVGSLVAAGYRCVTFDLRGHGDSGGSARSTAMCAADIAAMVRTELSGCIVVGASLGGVAALIALEDAEVRARVGGLVLVDVVPTMDPDRVLEFLTATTAYGRYAEIVDDVLAHVPQLRRAAEVLDVPVLLVRADGRTPVADDDVAGFLQLAPHARVIQILGAGHLVARDCPEDLAETIARWPPLALQRYLRLG